MTHDTTCERFDYIATITVACGDLIGKASGPITWS